MSEWIYPNKRTLKRWTELLEDPAFFLSQYLPFINEEWFDAVLGTVYLIRLSYYPDEFHHKATHIFYKICKNHYFVDSNKRSSVIVLYLFCIINGYTVTCSPEEVKKLAEDTAKIEGSNDYESDIVNIEEILKNIIVPIE